MHLRRPRHRWSVLAVGIVAQGAFSALHLGLPALAPALAERFGLGLVGLGALISAPALGTFAALLGWGILADRIGERPVLVTGLAGGALALAGAAVFSPTAAALGAWLVAAGLMGSAANAATGRAVAAWFAPGERGMAMGLRHMATPFAGGIAALALPALAFVWGLPAAFGALSVAAATAAFACAMVLGRAREFGDAPLAPPRPPFRNPVVWGLSSAAALTTLAQVATLAFMVVYLHDVRGWSVPAAAATLAAAQIVGALARPLAGVWSDRATSRLAPLRALAVVAAALLAGLSMVGVVPVVVAAFLLAAAAVSAMGVYGFSFAAVAEASGGARFGTALGMLNKIVFAAVVVAPPAFGALVAAADWPAAFLVLALAPLGGALGYRRLQSRRPARPAPG